MVEWALRNYCVRCATYLNFSKAMFNNIQVLGDATPCRLLDSDWRFDEAWFFYCILRMEAVRFSETSVAL